MHARPAACEACPLQAERVAHGEGREGEYPGRKTKRACRRRVRMLVVRDVDGALLLEQRPPSGVWGGLWSFPEIAADGDPLRWCRDRLGLPEADGRTLDLRRHTFSHFHLDIQPVEILLNGPGCAVLEEGGQRLV